ncbi:MAG: hypothetical protein WCK58_01515 [Chloroflexota bacterium]
MTFRGLSSHTSWTRWGLAAVAVGITVGATAPRVIDGLVSVAINNPGGLPWLFERVFAFTAYLAMTGSVVYGLLLSSRILDAIAHRPINFNLHKDLALLGIGLAAIHGALLMLDASMPFTVTQVLVPGQAPYAPLAVAAGQVALYLSMIVTASFHVRRRLGQRAWRTLHYTTFLAFVGSTAHGIGAGTDSSAPWAQWLYTISAAVVVFLLVYRIGMAITERGAADRERNAARTPFAAQPFDQAA